MVYIIIVLLVFISPFFYAQLLWNRGAKILKKRKKSLWWIIKTTFTIDNNKVNFD